MTFTRYQSRLVILTFLVGLLTSCSARVQQKDGARNILPILSSADCERGFIRPPGDGRCLNIHTLLSNNLTAAPRGSCPPDWQKNPLNGYCVPKYQVIACGQFTFVCHKTSGDTIRTTVDPIKCPEGSIVITVNTPLFDKDGALYITSRTALACGPLIKGEPV